MAMRILLVAEHASLQMGGEAALPVHYFRLLRARGVDAELIVHERSRAELSLLFPHEAERLHYLPDTFLNRLCWQMGRRLPDRLAYFTLGYLSRHLSQRKARRLARDLIARNPLGCVVHQPIPVSPREPSLLYDMGAPVVIGPMNGNISRAEGFGKGQSDGLDAKAMMALWRPLRRLVHALSPGKLRAALLLSANPRTTLALRETGTPARIVELVENGIDSTLWHPTELTGEPPEFLFIGRLIELKGAQYLPEALARMDCKTARLGIIGDGVMEPEIRARAEALGVADRITFYGFLPQAECNRRLAAARALVLPSLREAGGAVVLEAMACARPVIAADHGGPADYITPQTGWLVPVPSPEALIAGFSAIMDRLALDAGAARTAGQQARDHVLRHYDWDSKIDTIISLYQSCLLAEK